METNRAVSHFESEPARLQWKRLKKLNLVGERLAYLTRISFLDRLFARIFRLLLPPAVTPNALTVFRFISIPVIIYLLVTGSSFAGTILFVVAALSDAADGALARTTHQITKWGIIADPFADKLLIGSVAAIVITKYLGVALTAAIIGIEILLITSSYFRYRGQLMPAKFVGKIKMVLQCFGVGFVLLYVVTTAPVLLAIAFYVLLVSLVFAVLSLFVYRSI